MDSLSPPVAARLLALEGEAWLRHGGERLPLAQGSALAAGDVLETGPGSELQLQLASGHALALGSAQLLVLDADVLATAAADPGEWCCAPDAVQPLLATGDTLALDSVLDASTPLDHLLGPASAQSPAPAHGLPVLDDGGLQHLLRSLFGPEAH